MTKRNLLLDLQPFISEYSHYKKTVFNCLNTLKNPQYFAASVLSTLNKTSVRTRKIEKLWKYT
jgi:hypothetical protein